MRKNKLRAGGQILYIPIGLLRSDPMKPRIYFNNEELTDLCESICESGIIKPLTVREAKNGKYTIISGERRLRAAMLAGYETLPCILMKMTDEEAAFTSLTENMRQSGLNFFEFAAGIERIHERFYYSYDAIAEKLGIPLNDLNEKLKLLAVPRELRVRIVENGITEKDVREIIKLNDEDKEKLIEEITQKRLNVSDTRRRCREILLEKGTKKQRTVTYFKDITVFVNTIDKAIDTMEKSGIKAKSSKTEEHGCIEYRVSIPK